jgi:hypothetical protein
LQQEVTEVGWLRKNLFLCSVVLYLLTSFPKLFCFLALQLILAITAASIPGLNNIDDDAVEVILTSNTTRIIIVSAISLVSVIKENNVMVLCCVFGRWKNLVVGKSLTVKQNSHLFAFALYQRFS